MIPRAWHDRAFDELTISELHAIFALRQRVFVVEQACAYLDIDGADPESRHLWASAADADILAYVRILPPGTKYDDAGIGRVIVAPAARGTGLGRELMTRGIAAVQAHHGDVAIRIGAQAHLEAFYASLGFVRISEGYVEDGLPHVDMRLDCTSAGVMRG